MAFVDAGMGTSSLYVRALLTPLYVLFIDWPTLALFFLLFRLGRKKKHGLWKPATDHTSEHDMDRVCQLQINHHASPDVV